ncbi:hypothetical protein [Dyadobacter bucti]|uniref:hypothetical protein n=1 Tax=Dyadobacter bucti TaxID=2572203 RepID=UPI001107EC68|nr:hypothetical protein [Dyadobacter bucti]
MGKEFSIVVNNSPVKFAIVGPNRSRDMVWVKSDDAGLDLLATAMENKSAVDRSVSVFNFYFLLGLMSQFNLVTEFGAMTIGLGDYDDRQSTLRFVWEGFCTDKEKAKVNEIFSRLIYDIRESVMSGSISDLELSLAILVSKCSEFHKRHLARRRLFRVILGLYLLFGLLAFVYGIVRASVKFGV